MSKEFIRDARLLLNTHRSQVFALLETKVSGETIDAICMKLGIAIRLGWRLLALGVGIWIFWHDNLDLEIGLTHPQFVLCNIHIDNLIWSHGQCSPIYHKLVL